jgi:hypothetical protein
MATNQVVDLFEHTLNSFSSNHRRKERERKLQARADTEEKKRVEDQLVEPDQWSELDQISVTHFDIGMVGNAEEGAAKKTPLSKVDAAAALSSAVDKDEEDEGKERELLVQSEIAIMFEIGNV